MNTNFMTSSNSRWFAIVDPRTESWRQNRYRASSSSIDPVVAPGTTTRPPFLRVRTESLKVAGPTWSTITSTPRRPVNSQTAYEHPPGGHERQGRRRRGLEGQVCGNLQGVPRRDGDLFRVRPRKVLAEDPVIDAGGVVALHAIFTAPARDPRVQDDAVPDLEVRDVRAHRRDVAGPVRTEDVR